MPTSTERLPHVDEHSMVVAASPEATWEALLRVVEGSFNHRFSDYALIFRLAALDGGRTTLRAETRAAFPGLKGRIYRTLVIGTRIHILVTRRLLAAVKQRAERG